MRQTNSRARTPAAALIVLLLACIGLAACGSSSTSSSGNATSTGNSGTSSTGTSTSTSSTGASTGTSSTGSSAPAPGAAGRGAARAGKPSASGALNGSVFRRALASYAICLRQNGVNIPPPNASGHGPVFDTKVLTTHSPQFRIASMKCRGVLLNALRHLRGANNATPGAATPAPHGGASASGESSSG